MRYFSAIVFFAFASTFTLADKVVRTNVPILKVGADQNGLGWLKISSDGLRSDRCTDGYLYIGNNQILSTLLSAQAQGKSLGYLLIDDGNECKGGVPTGGVAQGCGSSGTSRCRVDYVEID